MVKISLALVTVVIIGLGIYTINTQITGSSQPVSEVPAVSTVAEKPVTVKATKELVKAVKEEGVTSQASTAKVVKKSTAEVASRRSSQKEIGEGLTLESIENADVSEAKKEIMIADLVVYQTSHMPKKPELTFEEGLELISSDVKNGILK